MFIEIIRRIDKHEKDKDKIYSGLCSIFYIIYDREEEGWKSKLINVIYHVSI
jgi:hypothetical protein